MALELPSEDAVPEWMPRTRRSVSERARESFLEVLRRTTRIVKRSKKAEDPADFSQFFGGLPEGDGARLAGLGRPDIVQLLAAPHQAFLTCFTQRI